MASRPLVRVVLLAALALGSACSSSDEKVGEPSGAKILRFEASSYAVAAGESVTLDWTTERAVELELLAGVHGAIELGDAPLAAGSVEVAPTETTIFRLLVRDAKGAEVEKSLEIRITDGSSIAFYADPATIHAGEGATLIWRAPDAAEVEISDSSGKVASGGRSGELEVFPKTTQVYTLSAGEHSAKTTVTVQPAVMEFAATSEGPFAPGEEVELRWKAAGAVEGTLSTPEGVSINLSSGQLVEGTGSIELGATTSVTLTVRSGSLQATETLSLERFGLPTIESFTVSAEEVSVGGALPTTVTFRWNVLGASQVQLEAQPGEVHELVGDELTLEINQSTHYTLRAWNSSGEVSDSVEVRAVPLPFIALVTQQRVEAGAPFDFSWSVNGAVAIELERDGLPFEGVGETEFEGTRSQVIASPTTYVLRAYNELGAFAERTIVVTVAAPQILSFTSDRPGYAPGANMHFEWKTDGGAELALVDADGDPVCSTIDLGEIADGSCDVRAPQSAGRFAYTLQLRNGARELDEEALELAISEGPFVFAFAAEPTRVTIGDEITLSWTVETDALGRKPSLEVEDSLDGTRVPLADASTGQDTIVLLSDGSRTLTLIASTEDTIPGTASVALEVLPEPEATVAASIDTYEDEPALLTWTSKHAVAVAIYALDEDHRLILPPLFESEDPDEVAGIGASVEVVPAPPETSYRVVVTNELGANGQASVSVGRLPVEIDSFTVSHSEVVATVQEVEFSWSTRRAEQVWIEPHDFRTDDPYIDVSESPTAGTVAITNGCALESEDDDPMECGGFEFPNGFTFPYYGEVYSRARVSHYGFLSFDMLYQGLQNIHNKVLPDVTSSAVHLAPFWKSDLTTTIRWTDEVPGEIIYDLGEDEEGRFLVVQWKNMVTLNNTQGNIDFEVILWESGNFDFRYKHVGDRSHDVSGALYGYQSPNNAEGQVFKVFGAGGTAVDYPGGLPGYAFASRPAGVKKNGSWRVYPIFDGPYTLVAFDGAESKANDRPMKVHPRVWQAGFGYGNYSPPSIVPTVGFTWGFGKPVPGDELLIRWYSVFNAERVDVLDEDGVVLCSGTDPSMLASGSCSFVENRSGEQLYTVRLSGVEAARLGNILDIQIAAPVYPMPTFEMVKLTPEAIEPGGSAILSWVINDATDVELWEVTRLQQGFQDEFEEIATGPLSPAVGQVELSVTESKVYELRAINRQTATEKVAMARVFLPVKTGSIDSVTVSKPQVQVGEEVSLEWTSTGQGNIDVTPAPFLPVDVPIHDIEESPRKTTYTMPTGSGGVSIPFPSDFRFRFYGKDYSSIRAFHNGAMSFTSTFASTVISPFATGKHPATAEVAHLAPFWGKLRPYDTGKIYTQRYQNEFEDYLIIQYDDFQLEGPSATVPPDVRTDFLTFQIVLYNDGPGRDGRFEFRYVEMRTDNLYHEELVAGEAAAIGFQAPDALRGGQLAFQRVVAGGLEGKAWRFTPYDPADGEIVLKPWETTDYEICSSNEHYRDCKKVRVVVPAYGDLLISELQLDPTEGVSGQWFEVRNTSQHPIDLEGMTIAANNFSYEIATGSPQTIQPGDYVTVGASPAGFTPSLSYGSGKVLEKSGDHLLIRTGADPEVTLASAKWGSGWVFRQGRSWALDPSRHWNRRGSSRYIDHWCEQTQASYASGNFGTPGQGSEGCMEQHFGYTIDVAAKAPFIDIAETGTTIGALSRNMNLGSLGYAEVPGGIGFQLPYFGGAVEDLWVTRDGTATFGALTSTHSFARTLGNGNSPTTGLIAPLWNGMEGRDHRTRFRYQLQERDGRKVMILQWNDFLATVNHLSLVNLANSEKYMATFQAQLWDDGEIIFAYKKLGGVYSTLGGNGTVGVENVGAVESAMALERQSLLQEGNSIRFTPKGN